MTFKVFLAATAFAATLAAPAAAQNDIVVREGVQSVTLSNGATTSAYNNPNGNSGAGTVTADRPRNGNGSLQITGDRSRYVIGNEFGGDSLFLLAELTSFNFDYRVDNNGSPNAYNTPVARIHVIDPGASGSPTQGTNVRSEIVWEGYYSGVTDAEGLGWQTTGGDGVYYANVRSNGATFATRNPGYRAVGGTTGVVVNSAGSQQDLSLENIRQFFSINAYVTGFSFGAGSGFGSDFVGYVDNVRFGIEPITARVATTSNVVNFEVTAAGAVPEPATWGLMVLGFGLVGAAARRRRAFAAA